MIQWESCFTWYHNQCIGLAEHLFSGLKDCEITYFCVYNRCNNGVPFCSVQGCTVKITLVDKYNNIDNDIDMFVGGNNDNSETVVHDDGDNFACDGTNYFTDYTDCVTNVNDKVDLAVCDDDFVCVNSYSNDQVVSPNPFSGHGDDNVLADNEVVCSFTDSNSNRECIDSVSISHNYNDHSYAGDDSDCAAALADDVSSISKHTAELVFGCELPDTAFFEEQVPCSATFSLPVGTLNAVYVYSVNHSCVLGFGKCFLLKALSNIMTKVSLISSAIVSVPEGHQGLFMLMENVTFQVAPFHLNW